MLGFDRLQIVREPWAWPPILGVLSDPDVLTTRNPFGAGGVCLPRDLGVRTAGPDASSSPSNRCRSLDARVFARRPPPAARRPTQRGLDKRWQGSRSEPKRPSCPLKDLWRFEIERVVFQGTERCQREEEWTLLDLGQEGGWFRGRGGRGPGRCLRTTPAFRPGGPS